MMNNPSDWSGTYGYPSYSGSDFDPQSLASYYNLFSQQQQQPVDMSNSYGINPHDAGHNSIPANGAEPSVPDHTYASTFPGYNVRYGMPSEDGDEAESTPSYNPYMMPASYADMMKAYQDAYGMNEGEEEETDKGENKRSSENNGEKAKPQDGTPYAYGYGASYGVPRGAARSAKRGKGRKGHQPKQQQQQQQQYQDMYDPRMMMMYYYPMMYGYQGMQQPSGASKEDSDTETDKGQPKKKQQAGTAASSGYWPGYGMPVNNPAGKGKRKGKAAKSIPDPPSYWDLYNPYMMGMNYPMMGMPTGEGSDSGIEKDKNGSVKSAKHGAKGKSEENDMNAEAYKKWYGYWQEQYASMSAQSQKQQASCNRKAASSRKNKGKKASEPGEVYDEEAVKKYYEAVMEAYKQQVSDYSKDSGSNDEGSGDEGKHEEGNEPSKPRTSRKSRKGNPKQNHDHGKAKSESTGSPQHLSFHPYYGMYDPQMMMMGMNPYANDTEKKKEGVKGTSEASQHSDNNTEDRTKKDSDHSEEGSDTEAVQCEKQAHSSVPAHTNMYHPMMPMYYRMMGNQADSDDDGGGEEDDPANKTVTKSERSEMIESQPSQSKDDDDRLNVAEGVVTEQTVGFSLSFGMPMQGQGSMGGKGRGKSMAYPAMRGMGWMNKKQQKQYQEMMNQWYKAYSGQLEDAEEDGDEDEGNGKAVEDKIKVVDDTENDADTEGQGDQESTDGTATSSPLETETQHPTASLQHHAYPSMMMPGDAGMNDTMMQRWVAMYVSDRPRAENDHEDVAPDVAEDASPAEPSFGFQMP